MFRKTYPGRSEGNQIRVVIDVFYSLQEEEEEIQREQTKGKSDEPDAVEDEMGYLGLNRHYRYESAPVS